jgi:hypothetical protein
LCNFDVYDCTEEDYIQASQKENGTLYYPLDTPITPTYEWQIKEDGRRSCYDYVLEEEIDADYCTDL